MRSIVILSLTVLVTPLRAESLRLPAIFGDHMVLQQDHSIPVWGNAKPNQAITVQFGEQRKQAQADDSGAWMVRLDAVGTSSEASELTVTSGDESVKFHDVLAGEVWLCSGQSNMGVSLSKAKGGEGAIAGADHSQLRLFRVKQRPAYVPVEDVEGEWIVCSPENVGDFSADFSAVGFFFGQQLLETLDRPIGLIGSYVGGSPVEAWMSEEALAAFPEERGKRSEARKRLYFFQRARDGMDEAMAEHALKLTAWEAEWAARGEAHHRDLAAWQVATQKAREANKPLPERPKPGPLSRRPLEPNRHPQRATVLFRGMIEPLIPYAIRGTIWYQGEANCYPRLAEEYATSFPMMIDDWRKRWGQGDFPFLYVQLPNFATGKDDWMTLRESQRLALAKVANSGMAITIDIGDPNDLHPADKKPVADRLARLARGKVYGEAIVQSGPLIHTAKQLTGGKVRLTFRHSGSGLQAKGALRLGGFEVAGNDGVFAPAEAKLEDDSVIVWRDKVSVQQVRYAWAPNPISVSNLYNTDGLPASPFSVRIEP